MMKYKPKPAACNIRAGHKERDLFEPSEFGHFVFQAFVCNWRRRIRRTGSDDAGKRGGSDGWDTSGVH